VKNCFIFILFPLFLFLPACSFADTIILKDGIRGTGVIIKVMSDTLYFIKSGSTQTAAIPRRLVARFDIVSDTNDISESIISSTDSVKSTKETPATLFQGTQGALNEGAEILPCHSPVIPDGCLAFTLVYKGCNFEIGETPTISLIRNTDFRENPYPHGTGFRAGGFVSAAWGTFFTILGGLLNGSNVKEAKGVEYTGLALLGNSAVLFSIGYTRKSKYNRWEERHPFKQPITIDKEE
jgi:hypothetical protein